MMKSINVEFGDHYRNHQPRVVWIPKKQHPIRDRNFLVSVFFFTAKLIYFLRLSKVAACVAAVRKQ